MTIDRDPRSMSDYAHTQERTHVKSTPNARPNFALRRAVVGLTLLTGAVLGTDTVLSHEQTICVATPGGDTAWDNGTAATKALRSDGAHVFDKQEVIDPLVELPNNQGIQSGIGVCAVQNTGLIGYFQSADIQIQA